MKSVTENHFQLEFRRARFPLRFICASVLALVSVWLITFFGAPETEINYEQLVSHILLISVFVLVSLFFLNFFNDILMQMRGIFGMFFGWGVIILVAVGLYIATYLNTEQSGLQWQIPYLRFIDIDTTSLLLLMVLLFGLPIFWVEKEVFSIQAMIRTSEMTLFSNLGFRIRPHFLFNTLNSVAHLISLHPARAEKALYNLADVFRVVMADKRVLVPLKAELDLADKYLYLEKTRLGERLQVASKIDPDSLGIMVPVLLLQPLLENAVYHGIETRFKGGTINISVKVTNKQLVIQVTNPLPEGSIKRGTGNKVAQENLRDRIYRTFGGRGTFDTQEVDDRYTVTIRLPL